MKKIKNKKDPFSLIFIIFFAVLLSIYCLSIIIPIGWGIMSSLKEELDIIRFPLEFPGKPLWSNYLTVIKNVSVGPDFGADRFGNTNLSGMAVNTLMYAVVGGIIVSFVPCIIGYLIQRFPNPISKFISTVTLISLVVPIVGNTTSMLQVLMYLKLYNSMIGMFIMAYSFCTMYTLIYMATFKTISKSYSEAAKIDGAGPVGIFFKINFPLCKNIFITIFLLQFIARWNDYYTPLLYMPKYPTLAYGLKYFDDRVDLGLNSAEMKLAGSMLFLLPVLTLFLIFNKRIMTNISMGGVKE